MQQSVETRLRVNPVGPRNARIAIVGEAPGAEEEHQGVPFVGPSGRLLDEMLAAAGIARRECYITNVVKERPPGNDFGVFYERGVPTPELRRWREELRAELRAVGPNVIVALGNEALRALTGDDGRKIGEWRGSIIGTPLGKVVPTYHPALVLRQWTWRYVVEFDLRKAKAESQTSELALPHRKLLTAPKLSEVSDFLAFARRCDAIAFDTETIRRGDPPRTYVDTAGIAVSPELSMAIPIAYTNGEPYWSLEDELEVWRLLRCTLGDPRIRKIAHNGQYDVLVLRRHGVKVANFALDTMNLANLVYPELPKSLDFLASVYTRQPYWKHMIGTDRWRYNAIDAAVTFEVAEGLVEDAREHGVLDFYRSHVHPLIMLYVEVQEHGVRVDAEKLTAARRQVEAEIEELRQRLQALAGFDLNVNSVKQMREFLYVTRRMPKRVSKSGALATDEQALRSLFARTADPALGVILKLRERRKLLSTYLTTPFDADGRMRCTYNVAGTETGRLSSSASIDGTGSNLQNVPHGMPRQVFVPDPGMVFVGADLSQAEARVVAWLAQDERMMDVFKQGGDIHKRNAALIFHKSEADVTPDERYLAKRVVHASNYGMGPRKFAQIAGITEREARALLDRYFQAFPRIQSWHREVERQVRQGRTLVNPFGRKRVFMERIGPELFREAYAYVPQSTVADQLHRASLEIWARLPEPARIVLQVHDSIVVQCSESQVEEVKAIVREALERPIVIMGRELVIPADVKVGSNWDEVS